MKQNLFPVFIAIILIYLPAKVLAAETSDTEPTPACESSSDTLLIDSLLTEDHLYEFTFSNFDLACRIINEMRARKKLAPHRLDIAEGDLYYNTEHYRRALKYYQRALQSDSVCLNDEELMGQYHRMISCYDGLNDDTNKAIYIKKLLEKAEQTQNQPMHSIALFNLGKMLYYQGNSSKGYQYINQAIELMEQTDYKYKHDNLYYDYHMLFIFLKKDHRYEEALKALDNLQKVIEASNEGEPYIQKLAEREEKILCAQRAVVLHRLGRTKEAEAFYHRWLKIGNAYDRDNYIIMPYLFDRQLYDDIIRINSAYEKYLQSRRDTISYRMTTTIRSLGNAYEAKGNFHQSSNYFYRLAIIIDSIKNREQQSAALELATVYEISEKEAQLQQQASELRERNISLICITLIVIGLGFGLWRTIKYNRIIRSKNMTMSHTISEQIAYKTQFQESRKEINRLIEQLAQMEKKTTAGNTTETTAFIAETPLEVETTSNSSTTSEPSLTERNKNQRIFEQLETILMEQKPFLDRNFSRDDLMRLAGVGRNAINPLIMECTGINANNYINDLRLEHAIIMLKENPTYTLNYIAEESGIPNMSTFHRLFRDKYNMTPTEFRNGLDKTIPKIA